MTNEKVVIGKGLFDCNGPNLFADGDNHKAECWGKWTAHGATPALADALLT